MELTVLAVLYILTILLPIHGIIFVGIRQERARIRAMLRNYWRLTRR